MSEPTAPVPGPAPAPAVAAPVAPPKTSFWEDLVDIFISPAAVFRRRETASPWPIFFFVVIAFAVIFYATFPAIQPAIDGEFARNLPRMQAQNPALTPELASKIQDRVDTFSRYTAGMLVVVGVLANGLLAWLLSKIFSAKQGFSASMLIAGYSYLPRVLGAVVSGAIALFMDPTKLNSAAMLTLSPARFLDPDKTSPFTLALLARLDITIIWETILLAIGVAIIGKIPKGKAAAFGVLIWIVGGLYALRNAYMIS